MKKILFSIIAVLFVSACTSVDMNGNVVNILYSEFSHTPPSGEAFEAPGKKVEKYEDLTTHFRAEAMNIITGFKYHRGDATDNAINMYKTDIVAIRYCKKLSRGHCVLSRYNNQIFYKDLNDYKLKMGLVKPKPDKIQDIQNIVDAEIEKTKSELEESNRIEREKLALERQKIELEKEQTKSELEEFNRIEREKLALERQRIELEKERILAAKSSESKIQDARLADDLDRAQKLIIKNTQNLLISLGYTPDANGEYGYKTVVAIKAFQTDNQIKPIDGEISENLLVALQSALKNASDEFDINNFIQIGSGSGFVADSQGYIVTNAHVINECEFLTVDKNFPAEVIKIDSVNDIAVIKTAQLINKKPLSISKSDPELGDKVFPAGFPINRVLQNLNFTSGSVSSEVGLFQNITQFQFTAPIQPGSSGGPILNENGAVIGITVASASIKELEEKLDTLLQNINFGIRKSNVEALLNQADIEYSTGNPLWFSNEKDVAEIAKSGTVLIKCWTRP